MKIQQLALEWAPPEGYTQRWKERKAYWRSTHKDGDFKPGLYVVQEITGDTVAREFVEKHHYSGTYPVATGRWGLYVEATGELVGVAVLSNPTNVLTLINAFPTLTPYEQSTELGRLVLIDEVGANAESWFVARVFRQAYAAGIRGIVAFSDPMKRLDAAGRVTCQGHCGGVYKALRARYTGRGKRRTLTILPDGHVFSDRAAQKIRAQEKGYHACEEVLVRMGATPRRDSQDGAEWLKTALVQVHASQVRHPGNHRYLFPLGENDKERATIPIGLEVQPYPKRPV